MGHETAQLLDELIRIKSVNPAGDSAPSEGLGEEAMAGRVAAWLGEIGLEPVTQRVAPGRANVYAMAPGDEDAPPVLFEAHMDTVKADLWDGDPWKPVVRDGEMYGRGSCDTKASLAAMLVALKRLVAEGRPRRSVLFLATCDEEFSFAGALAWVKLGLKARFGVVGEPTGLAVVRAHKGLARWDLATHGRSAHSAYRDEGVNAITRMAKVTLCLERFYQDVLSKRSHPLLGSPTLSPTSPA